ncbi:MAG: FAD-dependent oxidoreductase, partial [Verrucomicrobiaceae bacterium]|nr:FAD-dependent oxidoreductase [Verrucomicrobiaceae bacterium]
MRHLHTARAADPGWSRREFMGTAAMAAAGVLSGCAGLPGTGHRKLNGPVIIVGGGIAGLTAAYTLMKAGVECEIFEGSQRLGGRMFTKRGFNAEGMFCELGGELVDTNHRQLIGLCREVGVDIQPLKKTEKGVDFYHFGGRIYTDADVIPAFESLARRIAADAEGLTDAKGEYTAKAKALDAVNLKSYLAGSASTTPAWLLAMLDIAYTCELGLESRQQSALNLVNFIAPDAAHGFEMFGSSDEAWRVRGGNDTLPTTVAQRIAGKVKVHQGHELKAIASRGDTIALTFRHGGETVKREAAQVICAIPFTVLRGIEGLSALRLSAPKKR